MSVLEQETDLLSFAELSNPGLLSVRGEQPASVNCEKFVAFLLAGGVYCVSSKAVLEVIHPLPVAALPNAPAVIAGIAAFKGDVIAVVNITELLGLGISALGKKGKLVILRASQKDTQFAIPVDSMYELIAVSPEAISPDPASEGSLTWLVEHEGSVLKMIDTDILFERLEKSIG